MLKYVHSECRVRRKETTVKKVAFFTDKNIMRQYIKKQIVPFLRTLQEVHPYISQCNIQDRMTVLEQCQNGAIEAGKMLEKSEGENCPIVHKLEQYCEAVYEISQDTGTADQIRKSAEQLSDTITSVIEDINLLPVRRVVLFFPYKAAMWDSLESIWLAAKEDPECEAYVIPIPYFDRDAEGKAGQMHYEGDLFPEYVPITDWQKVDVERTHPEMAFIHNPYDQYNYVTSVHPAYYSSELKKYTETLVYVPYYSTTGGMSEAQSSLPVYYIADYIVTQSPKFIKFFDKSIPESKFLPLGSPKFDRVINMCKKPPLPPKEWEVWLKGRKVYFYNTSLAGFLETSVVFLKKMKYVFDTFKNRDDVVIIWRPHPLLESTLQTLRPALVDEYHQIRQYYIDEQIGILDETPDITKTIALCDAYIGDSGTSVTSLFGIAGKPLFILNNWIISKPGTEDWRGNIVNPGSLDMRASVTQGNCLYMSAKGIYDTDENGKENNFIQRKFVAKLTDYAEPGYYSGAYRKMNEDTWYLIPGFAENFLIYHDGTFDKKELKHEINRGLAFLGGFVYHNYLVWIPYCYPALVRYNLQTGQTDYFSEYKEVYATNTGNGTKSGGVCMLNGILYLGSPLKHQVVSFDVESGKTELHSFLAEGDYGSSVIVSDDVSLYFLPDQGSTIISWNPKSKEVEIYDSYPESFFCTDYQTGNRNRMKPFSSAAVYEGKLILAPFQANMFIRLDPQTKKMDRWDPPVKLPNEQLNGYYSSSCKAAFVRIINPDISEFEQPFDSPQWRLQSYYDNRYYRINLQTDEAQAIQIEFDMQELRANEPGFARQSGDIQYCCNENVFNSLSAFLDENIAGCQFEKEKQIGYFEEIASNTDGSCGEKIYQAVRMMEGQM